MTKAFFTKTTTGEWAIRVEGEAAVGDTVMSVRRNGEQRPVLLTEQVTPGVFKFTDAEPDTPAPAARKPRLFAPTAEQTHALELFREGHGLVIQAGAGTGKTSTLCILGEDADERGLRGQYIAFNNKIVAETAGKFPGSVQCNTAHSLAYRAVGTPFKARMDSGARVKSHEQARILRLDPVTVTKHTGESKTLTPTFLAGIVMKAVHRFCQTADETISYRHVPVIDGLDAAPSDTAPRSFAVNNEVARALEPALKRAWSDLTRFDGNLPFTLSTAMGVFLKLWQLTGPRINADYILWDEAQDASPVMIDVIAKQTHAQVVWVGDSNQAIYGFTGAIDALETVAATGARTAMLTQSFRFGEAVAEVANQILATLPTTMQLTGTREIPSRVVPVGEPRAILARTNATAIRSVMTAIANEQRPHLVGGGKDIASFCRAARELQDTGRCDHPEIGCFSSWGEVQEYVETDEQGEDLRLMVRLIDEFTVQAILDAVNGCSKEADADVIVSTAHKAKGCEWESVRLASDFPEKDKMNDDERRLLYVAVTRAKVELDITAVAFFAETPSEAVNA